MKSVSFKGVAETAYGKTLPTPVPFNGTFQAYESVDEIRSANDFPNDKEIVELRNSERKAKQVAETRTAALDAAGIEKPDPNSQEVMYQQQVKLTMKQFSVDEEAAKVIMGQIATMAAAAKAAKA